jgi:beta-N-acetylhexosaminidase
MNLLKILFKTKNFCCLNISQLYKTLFLIQFFILTGPSVWASHSWQKHSPYPVSDSINQSFNVLKPAENRHQSDVEQILSQMSLEEKIGQLFVFGFKEQEFTPSLRYFLDTYKPGGLLFFSRNGKSPEKVQKLIKDIKAHYKSINKIEPFFIVDHEGGEVVRVGPPHFFPSALSLGQTNDPSIAYDLGKWTGQYLKNIGFDINLAPVVDLRSEKAVNFIGERSFSSKPDEVVKIVSPFISGARSSGVLSVLKHFPGHGRVQEDSHFEVVRKISSVEELNQQDLMPFKKIIHQHPNTGVMTSHLSVPALDPTGELTTFSKPIVSKLANEYQHEGLVFTDDLDMLFFKNKKINIGEKSLAALKSGHDQVLIVWSKFNQKSSLNYIKNSVLKNELSDWQINEKLKKIIATKLRLKEDKPLNYKKVMNSLSKIYNLQNQINNLHFNNLPKDLIQEISSNFKSKKTIYLFSYSYYFYKTFKDNFTQGGYVPLTQENWLQTAKRCQSNLCFFHVSGDKSVDRIKEIPAELLKNMVVVNTSDPSVTNAFDAKKLNLFSSSNKFWKWFADEIKKSPEKYAFQRIKN